jgi:WD40 repeat protein
VVLPPIRGAQGVPAVAFSANGELLVSDSNGTVRLWNPATGQRVGTPIRARARSGVPKVAFSPHGDGTVRLWNAATGQPAGAAAPPPGAGCWP